MLSNGRRKSREPHVRQSPRASRRPDQVDRIDRSMPELDQRAPHEQPRPVQARGAVHDHPLPVIDEPGDLLPEFVDPVPAPGSRAHRPTGEGIRPVRHAVAAVPAAHIEHRVEAPAEELDRREGRVGLFEPGYRLPS